MLGTDPDAFVGLTDGSVPYDGPAVQKAFEIWGDMYAKGYFTDPREQDDSKFFADGTAAMFLIGDWHSGQFADLGMKPGVDFKTFLMPSVDPGRASIGHRRGLADRRLQGGARSQPRSRQGDPVRLMGPEVSNALGSKCQVYNGNLKGTPPNAIIKADNELVAAAKPRALVRWWEAVPVPDPGRPGRGHGLVHARPDPGQRREE